MAILRKGGAHYGSNFQNGGRIYHEVPLIGRRGDGYGKALCGARPSSRSIGWIDSDHPKEQPVTCPKCQKRLERIRAHEAGVALAEYAGMISENTKKNRIIVSSATFEALSDACGNRVTVEMQAKLDAGLKLTDSAREFHRAVKDASKSGECNE